jgi:3-oxoacyl-[acyl-carrier protein] reductase
LSKNKYIDKFFKTYEKIFKNYRQIIFISFATLADKKIITNNTINEIEKIVKLNIISVYYFISKLIKLYLGKKISIILIGSSRAIVGDKGISLYSISKNSMHSLAKSLAIEYGNLNVRANVISLGLFKTELWNKLSPNLKKKLIEKTSVRRMGTIHELNSTIKYVSNCNYLNGCILNLDGGYNLS